MLNHPAIQREVRISFTVISVQYSHFMPPTNHFVGKLANHFLHSPRISHIMGSKMGNNYMHGSFLSEILISKDYAAFTSFKLQFSIDQILL